MPEGIITDVDISFSNSSGASHKATIKAVEKDDAWDFKNTLIPPTAVKGELNTSLTLGNPELDILLKKFSTIEIVTSTNSVNTTVEFNMQDNLSLKLDSIIVALRGKDVGPLGEENFQGYIYNWTELPDNVKYSTNYIQTTDALGKTAGDPDWESYVVRSGAGGGEGVVGGVQAPEWKEARSTLVLGQIYNILELEDVKGETWTKAYINQERKFFLELEPKNEVWFINYAWPTLADPEEDRGSWQDSRIQLGYTLKELTLGLTEAGILWEGIPPEEEFLIEESGTLTNILSSAASKLGYYWYIDPILEKIIWIDSLGVEALIVTDYNDTTDEDVLSASFTENVLKSANVISYNTTIQETRREQPQRTQKDRKLKKSFKRLKFNEEIDSKLEYFTGIYYTMWNKDLLSEDYFNKLWYFGMHYSNEFRTAITFVEYEDKLKEVQADTPWDMKTILADYKALTNGERETVANLSLREKAKIITEFISISKKEERALPIFRYAYKLEKKDAIQAKGVQIPSEGVWFSFLKNYMDSGLGGLYMSGPVSKYRSDRIVWEGGDEWDVIGGWRWDELLDDIPILAPIAAFLRKYAPATKWDQVKDIPKKLYQSDGYDEDKWSKDRYYYFAVKKNNKKFLDVDKQDIINVFDDRIGSRVVETSVNQKRWLLIKDIDAYVDYVNDSRSSYDDRVTELELKEVESIPYRRLRHPVADEEHKDTEDDNVPTELNYDSLDLNREKRKIEITYPETQAPAEGVDAPDLNEFNPLNLENVTSESLSELEAIKRNKSTKLAALNQQQSSRTIYKLFVPVFSPEISSISLRFAPDGITTTIVESTLNILPTDESIIITRDKLARRSTNPLSRASAKKKNVLNL